MVDAKLKNRTATGFKLPQAKLSQNDINNIIVANKTHGLKYTDIAKQYNVTRGCIRYHLNKNKQLIQEQ